VSPIKRSHTVGWGLVATAILLLCLFTASKLYSNGVADSATTSAVDLGQQVQQACAAKTLSGPLCQKADDVVRDPAPSPLTAVGAAGQAGANGADGRTPPCYYQPGQCVGPEGKQGMTGIMGAMGIPGLDSTVPGPEGKPGRDGVDGKNGTDGKDGVDGQNGKDGADGKDAPPAESYSMPNPFLPGVTMTCTRNPGDPAHPTYACT
jgi:hypothetical protein